MAIFKKKEVFERAALEKDLRDTTLRISFNQQFAICLVIFIFGLLGGRWWSKPSPIFVIQQTAIPKYAEPCVLPNASEKEFYETAVSVLERINEQWTGWLEIGAQKALSQGIFRMNLETRQSALVCPPKGIYSRAAATMSQPSPLRYSGYQIDLASKIDEPPDEVVNKVAQYAFSTSQLVEDVQGDYRPVAFTVLARFGARAKRYSEQAMSQASSATSLGTGALQVAAATGHPNALPKIEALMYDILKSVPTNEIIPLEKRDRMYELAWAIYFAGADGKNHIKPIAMLMRRDVETFVPLLGHVPSKPRRMCELLLRIYGAESSFTSQFEICNDGEPIDSQPIPRWVEAEFQPNN